jgi:hypothetical protein
MVSAVVRVQTGQQDDKFVGPAGKANAKEEARWAWRVSTWTSS